MLVGTVEVTLLILLVTILAGPLVAERFRVPGLLGLIFFGMLFGPYVLDWLGRVGLVEDLGSIGILYLMFLAGLSFNMKAFVENRRSAITLGLLGFVVPFVLSIWASSAILEMELIAAALVGAMWASNTLVAYPDVRAAGLADNRGVRDAVSAGVVADLLSLFVLAVATSQVVIEISPFPILDSLGVVANEPQKSFPLFLGIPLLLVFTLWVLPKIGTWFFIRVGHSRVQRFVFALACMAAGAAIAVAAGVEGLIGAFLAGLGLNPRVPVRSELMDRIDFVGSSLFIPAFLVSIGLSIDPVAFFDLDTVRLGLLFAGLVVVGKTIAVVIGGLLFRLSTDEIGLMSALSYGQAASTLAIAQVGLSLGLFEQNVVNGAVLAIVLTALATSFGTRFFVSRVPRPVPPPAAIGERVLVDTRPATSDIDVVMEFAGEIAAADGGVLIPFSIPQPGQLAAARSLVERAEAAAAAAGHDASGVARISESFTNGSIELVEESEASLAVLAWSGPRFGTDFVLGSDIDGFGQMAGIPTVAVQLVNPWNRVALVLGNTRANWHKEDAELAMTMAISLLKNKEMPLVVFAGREGVDLTDLEEVENLEIVDPPFRARELIDRIAPDDLVVVPGYVLRDVAVTDQLRLARHFVQNDIAVVAGPNRLSVTGHQARLRMERLIGPSS